jgi:hypothetical protein
MKTITNSHIILVALLLMLCSFNSSKNSSLWHRVNLGKVENNMKALTNSVDPYVVRTYFSDDSDWEKISAKFVANYEMGFKANLEFLNDKKYDGFTSQELINDGLGDYEHSFIFIADKITFEGEDNSLLCIDLYDEIGRTFRVIPSELWGVENNLSISNMDFADFYDNCDEKGVFRGFE